MNFAKDMHTSHSQVDGSKKEIFIFIYLSLSCTTNSESVITLFDAHIITYITYVTLKFKYIVIWKN